MEITVPAAFLAGIVSFASPCFLPIVPAFVGQLIGAGSERVSKPAAARNALSFVAGFSVVFIALWASAGLIGRSLGPWAGWARILGGIVLVFMGLHLAGVLNIGVLNNVARATVTTGKPASAVRSAVMGVVFGAGWTPCIGPILGGILAMATMSATTWSGISLMIAYCLGLGMPIVAVALGSAQVTSKFDWFRRHHVGVSLTSGGFLLILGFLMITNLFAKLARFIPQFGI
ncbi:hypothetical protein HMPREF1531_01517 [Propionibacterium sp. oral taxon 192 str. F0372]|uniref:cytochrome c biogenesis CcdA family protein n=1 Tax=Propionibacterium sp. oral taxon 192 TaxID=671222 RepID=UPI000352CF91|nr:cytochrome c biogenesis protein CcdA [Propionibacterium sp. oral taxon 192]EPH03456.1 hypothetical protein HMPREF1531_01517 [Propionibacterium sp. oral taxon 192 str. F0372]